jgi:hypothetical protein
VEHCPISTLAAHTGMGASMGMGASVGMGTRCRYGYEVWVQGMGMGMGMGDKKEFTFNFCNFQNQPKTSWEFCGIDIVVC